MAEQEQVQHVVLRDGPIILNDAQFGVYYGNVNYDDVGVFYVVLSDAKCYQDKHNQPYLDSEGDMLVLQLKSELIDESKGMVIPMGEYDVVTTKTAGQHFVVDTEKSYVKRLTGTISTKWDLIGGSVLFTQDAEGKYEISTKNLRIQRKDVVEEVQYSCYTYINIVDYKEYAASAFSTTDDIVDMPFADIECQYWGDLWGRGTGNFILQFTTKDLFKDENVVRPGVILVASAFSRLYSGGKVEPHLENGRYDIVPLTAANKLFTNKTMLPGFAQEGTVLGSYMGQQVEGQDAVMEMIESGYMDVKYDEGSGNYADRMCTVIYDFKTSTRKISGTWRGKFPVTDYSTDESRLSISTLTDNVDCDFSDTDKYPAARLSRVDTLVRVNEIASLDYPIAETWQVWLEPRGWTYDEMDLPASERLKKYAGDGDVMVFEFVLPLGTTGEFAPEYDKTYTYAIQPSSYYITDPEDEAKFDRYYETFITNMGRPYDEIFDPGSANDYGYAFFMKGNYDYCNGRRGFLLAGGFRGNFYIHYAEGKHKNMDGHAPMVSGAIEVKRLTFDTYSFEWLLYDDTPGTPYYVRGSWTGKVVYDTEYEGGDEFRPSDNVDINE